MAQQANYLNYQRQLKSKNAAPSILEVAQMLILASINPLHKLHNLAEMVYLVHSSTSKKTVQITFSTSVGYRGSTVALV